MPNTIVVALGGNAILRPGQVGTAQEQLQNTRLAGRMIVRMIQMGHRVVITHGNGPQVGNLLIQHAAGQQQVPALPLDVCGAQSQGQLGYMIQQALYNELVKSNIEKLVVTVVTQTVVDAQDPAFQSPTKPVGPFYTRAQAEKLAAASGVPFVEDAGRGWRRVVPSPRPKGAVEGEAIRQMVGEGLIVIASGGGGVPVIRRSDYTLEGVEAVVDKDLAAAQLALQLHADVLLILTDVEKVILHYGRPEARLIDIMRVSDGRAYLASDLFAAGSMEPKVRAAVEFAERSNGRAVITALEKVVDGLAGRAGTQVVPDGAPAQAVTTEEF